MRALGLMSGTSVDGVDVAMIETDGERVEAFGPSLTMPYPDDVRRTILTRVPSTLTSWPASAAERGTFSSASPGFTTTTSSSPGSRRSSASFVRTQVSGQVTSVTSRTTASP